MCLQSPVPSPDTDTMMPAIMGIMWADHMVPVPYKVRGDHQIIHVEGDHTYMWGDHKIPVPYKVRGDHQIPVPYKVQLQGSHSGLIISYMWGDGMSLPLRAGALITIA